MSNITASYDELDVVDFNKYNGEPFVGIIDGKISLLFFSIHKIALGVVNEDDDVFTSVNFPSMNFAESYTKKTLPIDCTYVYIDLDISLQLCLSRVDE